jgi:hypothetical protein
MAKKMVDVVWSVNIGLSIVLLGVIYAIVIILRTP